MVGLISTVSGTQPQARTTAAAKTSDDGAFANALASAGKASTAEAQETAQATSATSAATASATPALASTATYLLPEGTPESSDKPSIAEFMKAAGCDGDTAVSVVYGTTGSNTDRRDWAAIMASDDPLAAARAGTGQMYKRPATAPGALTSLPGTGQPVVADSGNFAVLKRASGGDGSADATGTAQDGDVTATGATELALIDGDGNLLRKIGWNAPAILSAARDFGFDLQDLNGLADQLDAKGVAYKPHELYAGTGSDHGVDLRDLANGGLGSSYDWRVDPNAGLKGAGGAARLAGNVALAQEMGVEANPDVTGAAALYSQAAGAYQKTSAAYSGTGVATALADAWNTVMT